MHFAEKSKFKVNDMFVCLMDYSYHYKCGDVLNIIEVVPPNSKPKSFCHTSYVDLMNQFSYVVNCGTWNIHMLECDLSIKKDFMPQKIKWEDYSINQKQISTAIFEYLEKRGYSPNRKRGIKGVFRNGSLIVQVKKK